MSDVERCREAEVFRQVDAAFRAGDLEGLRVALGDPAGFPDVRGPITIGHCLEYAIYHSPLSFVRLLLERGADPNYADHAGFPSLIAALTCLRSVPGSPARADAHEILELLLDAGADPNQRGLNDYTPLHWAAGDGDERVVRLLLAHRADVTARTRIDEYETPREVAQRAGHQAVAELLDQHVARHGRKGSRGRRAMRHEWEQAVRGDDVSALERLLDDGADLDARDAHGQTSLMLAVSIGSAGAAAFLVERGAALDHTAKYHLSALMLAVLRDQPAIVRLLVTAGADVSIRGSGAPGFHGKIALDLADAAGRTEIAAILREAGSRHLDAL